MKSSYVTYLFFCKLFSWSVFRHIRSDNAGFSEGLHQDKRGIWLARWSPRRDTLYSRNSRNSCHLRHWDRDRQLCPSHDCCWQVRAQIFIKWVPIFPSNWYFLLRMWCRYSVNLRPFFIGDDRGTGGVREAGEGVLKGRKAGNIGGNYATMLKNSTIETGIKGAWNAMYERRKVWTPVAPCSVRLC